MESQTYSKVHENRLRRMAKRQGLTFTKVRRHDPLAIDYGTWRLLDEKDREVFSGPIEEAEKVLLKGRRR